jgi:hypothetical protein
MSQLNINIGSHGDRMTVREMRKRLAKVLAQLHGTQEVSFNFSANLENYRSPAHNPTMRDARNKDSETKKFVNDLAAIGIVLGELARPENE